MPHIQLVLERNSRKYILHITSSTNPNIIFDTFGFETFITQTLTQKLHGYLVFEALPICEDNFSTDVQREAILTFRGIENPVESMPPPDPELVTWIFSSNITTAWDSSKELSRPRSKLANAGPFAVKVISAMSSPTPGPFSELDAMLPCKDTHKYYMRIEYTIDVLGPSPLRL